VDLTPLETGRLVLREPVDADARAVMEYRARNEPRFARWEPDFVDDIVHHRGWVADRRAESAAGRGRSFLAWDRAAPEDLVALVNLYAIRRGPLWNAILGYSVDGDYEGRGYAREAVEAAIEYAFGALNLHRIIANYDPRNERSGALLRRLGFVVEGYARDMLYLRGRWRDHVMTALVNPAWTPPQP
jgi:ribosomal-protein-alanine N-acetyltransferase